MPPCGVDAGDSANARKARKPWKAYRQARALRQIHPRQGAKLRRLDGITLRVNLRTAARADAGRLRPPPHPVR